MAALLVFAFTRCYGVRYLSPKNSCSVYGIMKPFPYLTNPKSIAGIKTLDFGQEQRCAALRRKCKKRFKSAWVARIERDVWPNGNTDHDRGARRFMMPMVARWSLIKPPRLDAGLIFDLSWFYWPNVWFWGSCASWNVEMRHIFVSKHFVLKNAVVEGQMRDAASDG